MLIALTGGEEAVGRAAEIERFIAARVGHGAAFEHHVRSLEDLRS